MRGADVGGYATAFVLEHPYRSLNLKSYHFNLFKSVQTDPPSKL